MNMYEVKVISHGIFLIDYSVPVKHKFEQTACTVTKHNCSSVFHLEILSLHFLIANKELSHSQNMAYCIILFQLHWQSGVVLIRRMINMFQIWVTGISKAQEQINTGSFALLEDKMVSFLFFDCFLFLVSIQCWDSWQGHSQVHVQVYNGAERVCGSLCWFKGLIVRCV